MSIATMTRLGLDSEAKRTTTRSLPAAGDESAQKAVTSATERIAAFIPSEAIGAYVAGFGIFSPDGTATKWVIFVVALILIPTFIWLNYAAERKKRQTKKRPSARTTWLVLVFAVVAYTAWAAAMPGSPFLEFTDQATRIGGFAVVVLAGVMYKAGELVDIVPSG